MAAPPIRGRIVHDLRPQRVQLHILAKRLAVDESTLFRWESRGKQPTGETLVRLKTILATPTEEVAGRPAIA